MFDKIPAAVIDFVRGTFATANDKVSRTLTVHPSMHEESLDHLLIAELTATPPTFFSNDQAAVGIETHWLGGRRMYGRWEIADIALFIILRISGKLEARKTALIQTKRLYSKEIPTSELEEMDYQIGIGRIADKTDQIFPLSVQRAFSFDDSCVFGAMTSGSPQVQRIEAYIQEKNIPVYYGLYCPVAVPYSGFYPTTAGSDNVPKNDLGCRIQSSIDTHAALGKVTAGKAPTLSELRIDLSPTAQRPYGWSLQEFVADEVLRCREGRLFDGSADQNLQSLFYERSAPISAAISITIDIQGD